MDGKQPVGVSLCHLGGRSPPPPGRDSEHPAGPREKGSPSGLEERPPLRCSPAIPAEIRKAALEAQQREQARKAAAAAAQNSDGEMEVTLSAFCLLPGQLTPGW